MRTISIPNPNSSFAGQLTALYRVFKGVTGKEDVNFDLNKLNFAFPLLLLPISSYINTTGSAFALQGSSKVKSYLDTIRFPKGIDSVSSLQEMMQRNKSYIPIGVLKKDTGVGRERLEGLFMDLVYKTIDVDRVEGARSAIFYPITELITNIFEHSKSNTGFILGQFYPQKRWLDICIIDRGRGLSTAYEEEKSLKLSDAKAIIEVMSGNSIKSDRERGYGVRTSKSVICEALGGEFVLVSGSAALFASGGKERLVSLPQFYWQGVIVGYRIPKPKSAIDITPYLE